MYVVFTDGGARGNGKGASSWAFAVYEEDQTYVGSKSEGYPAACGYTNNYTELTAVLRALQWAEKAGTEVSIRTDSNYVNKGINEWMPNWVRNNWRTAANKPVKNAELWQDIHQLYNQIKDKVTISHVPGHASGSGFNAKGNTRADALCNVAMDEQEFTSHVLK